MCIPDARVGRPVYTCRWVFADEFGEKVDVAGKMVSNWSELGRMDSSFECEDVEESLKVSSL